MSIMHRLVEKGMNVVGVPKTIDNDLVGTERTFGFDTAVSIATEALDRLHTTAQSHHRVIVLETMGRYAGWIALHSGIASGADVILIPEIPFDIDEVARVCKRREDGGQRFTIIVAAEGAVAKGGAMTIQKTIEDSPDPIRLGGVCRTIEYALEQQLDSEIRTTILGHVQRGGTPTAFDRTLATAFGAYAAQLVAEEQFGCLVVLNENKLGQIGLDKVANKTRTVPLDSPLLATAHAVGTSFGVANLDVAFRTHRRPPAV